MVDTMVVVLRACIVVGLCCIGAPGAIGIDIYSSFNSTASVTKPSVMFVLVDDNGWAGIGYNNPYLNTPTLDALAEGGLKLTSSYVYKYCAPTRGAFLTGRFPFKLAATRSNFIPWTLPDGTHLSYAMLPKKLASAGYVSYHVGKWHQGFVTPEYTPTGRGFNYSYGFLEGGEDHNTSLTFGNWCRDKEVDLSKGTRSMGKAFPYDEWPTCTWTELPDVAVHSYFDKNSTDILLHDPWMVPFSNESACKDLCANRIDCAGYSWRFENEASGNYHKCFLVSRVGGAGAKNISGFKSAMCTRPKVSATTIPAVGDNGTYTGELFNLAAERFIQLHKTKTPESPMFMYYAMHDTHAPLEAPWRFVEQYVSKFPGDTKRQIFSGMVSFVDEAMKNLTDTLKRENMWSNTLFVWLTDNGSPVSVGGSNHPLRGGKGSNWEGGTRIPSFVTGGILPSKQIGKVHDGLIHIVDWHATICELAGVNPTSLEPNAVSPLDGMSAWSWISGQTENSKRTRMVYDHRMFLNASKPNGQGCYLIGNRCASGAIRQDGWKLVVGPEHQNSWFGWFSPNISLPFNKTSPVMTDSNCVPPNPCLFNLNQSMTEHEDVAGQNPRIVAELLAVFDGLADEYHPPINDPPIDLSGYCGAVDVNSNFVGPWMLEQRVPPHDSL